MIKTRSREPIWECEQGGIGTIMYLSNEGACQTLGFFLSFLLFSKIDN